MPLCVSDYILCIQDLIFKQKYITDDHMLTLAYILIESSNLVLYLYGLMQRILHLISVAQIFNETMPLVQHRVITNEPIYGVSYLYAVCLVRMTLSPTLKSL